MDAADSLPLRDGDIDRVRAFWDLRPCNVRHSPRPVGTREYFDEVETRKYFVEPHIPAFAQFAKWRGKKVLEIGCGIGTDTINFARHGALVTAIELSERSLELARQRAVVYGLADRIRFYLGDGEVLSTFVPVEPYDLVYSFGVIHHTPRPERVLNQMTRYLARGSIVKIMVYHRHAWKVWWIIARYGKGRYWRAGELVRQYSEAQEGCPVTHVFTRQEVADLLVSHGLQVKELWVDHIFPYRIHEYTQYRYVKTRSARLLPAPVFRWLERRIGWHVCVTAKA